MFRKKESGKLRGWSPLLGAAIVCVWSLPALAEQSVEADFVMPAAMSLSMKTSGCSNRGGPEIELAGDLFRGGLKGKLRAENAGGVHGNEVDAFLTAKLTDSYGNTIVVPKQPIFKGEDTEGAGGNPFIWFDAKDADGRSMMGGPRLLGRCVQGLFNVAQLFALAAHAEGTIGGSCDNSPHGDGPASNIVIDGALVTEGIVGEVIFTNQDTLKARHKGSVPARLTFEIIPDGGGVTWPKQPFKDVDGDGEGDGVTGNPILYFVFQGDNGDDVSKEWRLGRCNKL